MKIYLAGPMSGYPQFNFPLFYEAAARLRALGFDVVSPAEMDAEHGVDVQAMASVKGDLKDITETWGDLLSRDVKMIADGGINGIVFLPHWERSKGARLEATVGILKGNFSFFEYGEEPLRQLSAKYVAHTIYQQVA